MKYTNPQVIELSGFFIVQRNVTQYSYIQPKECPLLEFFHRHRVIASINACLWTGLAKPIDKEEVISAISRFLLLE